jgi:hypothetical protein
MVFPVVVFSPPTLLASRIGADALVGMKDGGEKLVAAERAAAGLSSHWTAPGMESKPRFSVAEARIESVSEHELYI